jgi:hypothetical protein
MNLDVVLLLGVVTVSALRVLIVRAVNNEIDRQRASRPQPLAAPRRQGTVRPSARPTGFHTKARPPLVGRHS